jgi:hypothetical protein
MKKLISLLSVGLALCLSSCIAPMDNPKVATIKVNEYLAFGDGVMLPRYTLPTGVYRYVRTWREGHLYQAPEMGTLRDTGIPFKQEGGILWRFGKPEPDRIYRKNLAGILVSMPGSGMMSSVTLGTEPPPELVVR